MNLQVWIKKQGIKNVSKMLGVSKDRVGQWARGYVLPQDALKKKIVSLTKGEVTYASMIEYHYSTKNRKNRFGV